MEEQTAVTVVTRKPEFVLNSGLYPSVTRIIDLVPKPFLVPWANKIGREGAPLLTGEITHNSKDITDQSREVGIAAHKAIEQCLTKAPQPWLANMDKDSPIRAAAIRAYSVWQEVFFSKRHDYTILGIEQSMESHKFGYNGRADLIIETKDGIEIIDWKTSNALYPETRMEMAAYAQLAVETFNKPVVALHAIRLDYQKEPTFDPGRDTLDMEEYMEDLELFTKMVPVFHDLQRWQAKYHS